MENRGLYAMKAELAAFFSRERLLSCVGFGLLWSMTKGMMNTDVFAYPDSELDFDPVFLVYLFLSFGAALAIALCASAQNKGLRSNSWLLSVFFALGITVLASQEQLWPRLLGCAVCAVALSVLLLKWVRVFTATKAGELIIVVPLAFVVGNIFAWIYTIVGNETAFYLYVMVPFISSAIYLYASEPTSDDDEGADDDAHRADVTLATIFRRKLPRHRLLLAPFLAFFSISLISIAVSYLFLTKGPIPGSQQVFIHLVAPTLGALIAFFARNAMKSGANLLLLVLMPILATMLFILPLLGYNYVLLVKGLLMALVEYLIIMSLYLTVETTRGHSHDAIVLAAVLLALLGLSTLLGILSGLLFSFTRSDDGSLLWIMGTFSLYLLFMAFLVLVPRQKKDGGEARGAVVRVALTSDEDILDALRKRFRLSARERDVLGYLAAGRSSRYIASNLVLSEETVRGHIKRIYQKMSIHSKQELLDIVQESLSMAAKKTPLKKG
jgi:DNA-binding CsgD family transcriptional regulator